MSFPTLEITTMIGCPLMCNFCPQDNLRDNYGKDVKYMPLETFSAALDNIAPDTRIDFSGMAEPWVNPNCTDMLATALERGFRVAIYTTLYNWSRETTDRVAELFAEYSDQIDVFSIHFPDEYSNMKGWKYNEDWEYALHVMQGICQHYSIKSEGMTMSGRGKLHPDLQHLGIQLWSWQGHDRAGSLPHDQIGEQPVLLAQQSHTDIRAGDAFKNILKENARNCFSNDSLCRTCTDAVKQ